MDDGIANLDLDRSLIFHLNEGEAPANLPLLVPLSAPTSTSTSILAPPLSMHQIGASTFDSITGFAYNPYIMTNGQAPPAPQTPQDSQVPQAPQVPQGLHNPDDSRGLEATQAPEAQQNSGFAYNPYITNDGRVPRDPLTYSMITGRPSALSNPQAGAPPANMHTTPGRVPDFATMPFGTPLQLPQSTRGVRPNMSPVSMNATPAQVPDFATMHSDPRLRAHQPSLQVNPDMGPASMNDYQGYAPNNRRLSNAFSSLNSGVNGQQAYLPQGQGVWNPAAASTSFNTGNDSTINTRRGSGADVWRHTFMSSSPQAQPSQLASRANNDAAPITRRYSGWEAEAPPRSIDDPQSTSIDLMSYGRQFQARQTNMYPTPLARQGFSFSALEPQFQAIHAAFDVANNAAQIVRPNKAELPPSRTFPVNKDITPAAWSDPLFAGLRPLPTAMNRTPVTFRAPVAPMVSGPQNPAVQSGSQVNANMASASPVNPGPQAQAFQIPAVQSTLQVTTNMASASPINPGPQIQAAQSASQVNVNMAFTSPTHFGPQVQAFQVQNPAPTMTAATHSAPTPQVTDSFALSGSNRDQDRMTPVPSLNGLDKNSPATGTPPSTKRNPFKNAHITFNRSFTPETPSALQASTEVEAEIEPEAEAEAEVPNDVEMMFPAPPPPRTNRPAVPKVAGSRRPAPKRARKPDNRSSTKGRAAPVPTAPSEPEEEEEEVETVWNPEIFNGIPIRVYIGNPDPKYVEPVPTWSKAKQRQWDAEKAKMVAYGKKEAAKQGSAWRGGKNRYTYWEWSVPDPYGPRRFEWTLINEVQEP